MAYKLLERASSSDALQLQFLGNDNRVIALQSALLATKGLNLLGKDARMSPGFGESFKTEDDQEMTPRYYALSVEDQISSREAEKSLTVSATTAPGPLIGAIIGNLNDHETIELVCSSKAARSSTGAALEILSGILKDKLAENSPEWDVEIRLSSEEVPWEVIAQRVEDARAQREADGEEAKPEVEHPHGDRPPPQSIMQTKVHLRRIPKA